MRAAFEDVEEVLLLLMTFGECPREKVDAVRPSLEMLLVKKFFAQR